MIERITQTMLSSTTLYNIQKNTNRMVDLNQQLTSGKRMQFPSDDPASAVDSLRLHTTLKANQQYKRNIDDANGWMATVDSNMQDALHTLGKVKEILITSNSGAQGPGSRDALAKALEGEASNINKTANATYLGRTVFAGNSDKGLVFKENATGIFEQTELGEVTAGKVERQINSNQYVQANVDGNQLYGTQTVKAEQVGGKWVISGASGDGTNPNLMNLIRGAAQAVREDPMDSEKVMAFGAKIDEFHAKFTKELSAVGARHDMVIKSQDSIISDIQAIQQQISGVEDVDVHAAIVDMSLAEMAYKASLGATQRVIQPTLLDYLR